MIDAQSSKTDPLSDIVALSRPRAVAWRVFEAHDGWSVRFPATELTVFGQMIEGRCQIQLSEGSTREFETGDFLLMSAPASWIAQTDAQLTPIDFESVIADPTCLLAASSNPVVTRFIAGAFMFAAPNAGLLADFLLPMIHLRGSDVLAGRLGALLTILGDEAVASRPGRSLILDRLLEIILVETLRHRPGGLTAARPGLLAGLADPRIGSALRMMHDDARRPWTVAALARAAGMSRSSFAARFAETVGSPPIDYLSSWRISLAKDALTSSRRPLCEIAQLAGYQSVSAFSTAFSRATGRSPTAYQTAAA
jgi:AraC-like DNA-binding protein